MRSRLPRARTVLFMALAVSGTPVRGADRYFAGQGTANWANAANWAAFQGGAGGVGIPASGDFVFTALQPGPYSLGVRAAGFKLLEKTDLELTASERLSAGAD